MLYVVTYENTGNRRFTVDAPNEDAALEKFVTAIMLPSELFREYLYDFSVDGLSRHFINLVPAGVHHDIKQIQILRKKISQYFGCYADYAEIYFDFFMNWFPVEAGDKSEEGKRLLERISEKMKNYRFPNEMEIYIAKKEAKGWCNAKVTKSTGGNVSSIF